MTLTKKVITVQSPVFKENVAKFYRIEKELSKYGLESYGGSVIDPKMIDFKIVCDYKILVESSNFLSDNPIIKEHLKNRERMNKEYIAQQAEAHAWSHREINA